MRNLMIVSLCLAAQLLPASALASCVYNKAETPIDVDFDCGAFCHNVWTIPPSGHKCRPGKGGKVTVRVMDRNDRDQIDDDNCQVKVDKHGWVTVYQDGKKVTVKSKHKGGLVREECHLNFVGRP